MGTSFGLNIEGSGKRKPRKHEEADLQVRLMRDLEYLLPKDALAFAVPNGGSRHPAEAANLKRQGVRAGVPDIVIVSQGRAFGLELKSKGGALNPNQRVTFPLLQAAGMRIEVARTHPEALEYIKQMGVKLRIAENNVYDVRDVFRDATKRRPG